MAVKCAGETEMRFALLLFAVGAAVLAFTVIDLVAGGGSNPASGVRPLLAAIGLFLAAVVLALVAVWRQLEGRAPEK